MREHLNPLLRPALRRAGFTAIEVTAVATIVALMALVLIPIVRNRVEESKRVAAQDDMNQIEKAEMMAFGYTGHYFRLQDLVRPEPTTAEIQAAPSTTDYTNARLKVPQAYWDYKITSASEISSLVQSWKGPFFTIHRGQTVPTLAAANPTLWRGTASINGVTLGSGPLLTLEEDKTDWEYPDPETDGTTAIDHRLYPTDPWGNPYLFFGTGVIDKNELSGTLDMGGETKVDYSTAAIYSLGPNGVPGDDTHAVDDTQYYFREKKILGTDDDLKREF